MRLRRVRLQLLTGNAPTGILAPSVAGRDSGPQGNKPRRSGVSGGALCVQASRPSCLTSGKGSGTTGGVNLTTTQSQDLKQQSTPKQISVKGPWIVARMSKRWEKKKLGFGTNPKRLHPTLLSAATEASRLAQQHPGEQFALFECIGYMEVPGNGK